jgi:hypothetical protein
MASEGKPLPSDEEIRDKPSSRRSATIASTEGSRTFSGIPWSFVVRRTKERAASDIVLGVTIEPRPTLH